MDYQQLHQHYVRDRNRAFMTMDEQKIKAHCVKYGVEWPQDPKEFWAGVHRMCLLIETVSQEQKRHSENWLETHGFPIVFHSELEKLCFEKNKATFF